MFFSDKVGYVFQHTAELALVFALVCLGKRSLKSIIWISSRMEDFVFIFSFVNILPIALL